MAWQTTYKVTPGNAQEDAFDQGADDDMELTLSQGDIDAVAKAVVAALGKQGTAPAKAQQSALPTSQKAAKPPSLKQLIEGSLSSLKEIH